MPSPTWCDRPETPPLAAAIAAAVHVAWDGPEEGASTRFTDALRKILGDEEYEVIELRALHLFHLQPRPPEGYRVPPDWAWLALCPRCMKVKGTPHTAAQNGRLELEVLRDPEWMARQFDRGESYSGLAERLDCAPALIRYWAEKHGLKSPAAERTEEIEACVRRMYAEGEGNGTIAKELDTSVRTVRDALRRLGLATKKSGQVHHEREWWRVRLADRGMTKAAAAREAGIKSHGANYYLKKFNLGHLVDSKRKKPRKYPELYSRTDLRLLLARHDHNYESVAEELGCASSFVSRQARTLLGLEKKHHNVLPHSNLSWWTERLDAGATTYELAEEAGIEEKSARERCRVFGLLPQAYHNNAERERERRKERRFA